MKKSTLIIYFLFIFFLTLFSASVGLTATPSQDKNAEFFEFGLKGAEERFSPLGEKFEKARIHFKKREFAEALRLLELMIEERPNFALAYFLKGCCEGTLGRYQDSIKSFNKVISIDQNYENVYQVMGLSYYNLKRYNEAEEYLKKAIKLNPEDARAYSIMGLTYNDLERYEEAVEILKKAVAINPKLDSAYNNIGIAYLNLNLNEEAIEIFKKAISISPKNAKYHHNLGVAYEHSGRLKDAVKSFKKAVKLDPGFALAYYNLGITYLSLDDKKSALKQYEALKELDSERANKLLERINSEKEKATRRPQKPPVPIITGKEEGVNIHDLSGTGYTMDSSWYAKGAKGAEGAGGREVFVEKFVNSNGDIVLRLNYKGKVFGYSIIGKNKMPFTVIDSKCNGEFDYLSGYYGLDKFPMPDCLLK